MRFSEKESLDYLKKKRYDISPAQFYRIKKRQEETKFARISEIARNMYTEQTLERIDTIIYIQKEMWDNYHQETSPRKRVEILKDILLTQPYISAYVEAARYCQYDTDFPYEDNKERITKYQKNPINISNLSSSKITDEKLKEGKEYYQMQKEKAVF